MPESRVSQTLRNGLVVETVDGPAGAAVSWVYDRTFCRYRCASDDPSLMPAFLDGLAKLPFPAPETTSP